MGRGNNFVTSPSGDHYLGRVVVGRLGELLTHNGSEPADEIRRTRRLRIRFSFWQVKRKTPPGHLPDPDGVKHEKQLPSFTSAQDLRPVLA